MIFVILLTLFDQIAKYLVRHDGGFYICNSSISFGISLTPFWIYFSWIVIVLIVFNLYKLDKTGSKINKLAYLLILSGAFGNIIDRIYLGCIIDFVNIKIWPIFNLADAYLTIGLLIIIIKSLIDIQKEKNSQKQK